MTITFMELTGRKRKRGKRNLDIPLIYIGSGVTMIIVAMATMLINTQFISLNYEVGTTHGLLSGSSVGILPVGEIKSDNLSHLENASLIPFIGVVDEHDPQLTVDHHFFVLHHHETMDLTYKVTAAKVGRYHTPITVALLYPLLPPVLIQRLVGINFWLAFGCIAIIPGLPFILYPFISRKMRRPILRSLRRKMR